MDCAIYVAKTGALICCMVTMQLICGFVFANAKNGFSHDVRRIETSIRAVRVQEIAVSFKFYNGWSKLEAMKMHY